MQLLLLTMRGVKCYRPGGIRSAQHRSSQSLRVDGKMMRIICVLLIMVACSSPALRAGGTDKATLAQRKANTQAIRGKLGHVGGGFAGGRAEGVGKGRTRDSAIRNCCYWGKRQPIQIGAAKSARGWWYACVIYR